MISDYADGTEPSIWTQWPWGDRVQVDWETGACLTEQWPLGEISVWSQGYRCQQKRDSATFKGVVLFFKLKLLLRILGISLKGPEKQFSTSLLPSETPTPVF